jgi:ABC-type iron transport system FetAB ATPase subunit
MTLMPGLRIENLSGAVFGPIDLTVEAGACVGLFGSSGAGKTMLLRAVADLDPHAGLVALGDRAAETFDPPDWRRRVGLLAAESAWWGATVGEHFSNGAAPALGELGFGDEVMAWSVERLSTGERQRLALLRLLAGEPEALLLDEPTANLDPENAAAVEALVASYRAGRAAPVIWVAHDRGQLRRVADRAYRMSAGSLEQPPLTLNSPDAAKSPEPP